MTDDQEMRCIALEIAAEVAAETPGVDIVALAERFVAFVVGGAAVPSAPAKRRRHRLSDAGADALRRLWPTEPDTKRVFSAVREAEKAPDISDMAMRMAASRMGLRRPASALTPAVLAMHAAKRARVSP